MSGSPLRFVVLDGLYAVGRLDSRSAIPAWAEGEFVSITRTRQELSIVCAQKNVPPEIRAERDWRVLKIVGPIPFSQSGVTVSIAAPLATAGISLLPIATYDTDYFLVKSESVDRAVAVLEAAGHRLER